MSLKCFKFGALGLRLGCCIHSAFNLRKNIAQTTSVSDGVVFGMWAKNLVHDSNQQLPFEYCRCWVHSTLGDIRRFCLAGMSKETDPVSSLWSSETLVKGMQAVSMQPSGLLMKTEEDDALVMEYHVAWSATFMKHLSVFSFIVVVAILTW